MVKAGTGTTGSVSSVHAVPRWSPSLLAQAVPAVAKSDAATMNATRIVFSLRISRFPLARDLYGLERLLVHVLVLVRLNHRLAARRATALLDADLDERFNDDGVELGSGVRAELAERVLRAERHAVPPVAGHRVVRVGDGHD